MFDGFCKECHCRPCQCKNLKHARKHGALNCFICGAKLGLRGGMSGTNLCGPCCTGESESLDEFGYNW